MKLSKLLSNVLDGQKLVDNLPDKNEEAKPPVQEEEIITKKSKTIETPSELEPKVKAKSTKVKKTPAPVAAPVPELPTPITPEAKQKHDEEIAAKIKAQIKKSTKPVEPPARTMSVPDFAKIRELTKQAKKPAPPVQETAVEKTPIKTDTPKT
jgi:hypothetical protein